MREPLVVALLVLLFPILAMAASPDAGAPMAAGAGGAPAPAGPPWQGEKVTLAAAVQRALDRNPTVAVAVSEIGRADALVTQARAGWLPILNGNGIYTRLDHDRVFSGSGGAGGARIIAAKDQLAGNLTLTVPLVAAPAWAETSHAKSQRRIAEASAVDVRRQVAQTTARAYITVVAQHRLVAASETARETAKAHYDYAHTRLAGGIGRAIDEVRAQQDLATVETQLQANLARLALAREAMGVLMAVDAPVDALEDVELAAPPSMPEALEAVRGRTDVKVLDMRIASAQHSRNDVWAFYAPYLAAIGEPFVQHPATLQLPSYGWQAQLVLTLPLFDGGLRQGVTRERDAVLAEAKSNFEAGLRQAQSEVRVDFEAMVRADAALTSARDADTAAAQAEDLARQARLDLLVASGRFP